MPKLRQCPHATLLTRAGFKEITKLRTSASIQNLFWGLQSGPHGRAALYVHASRSTHEGTYLCTIAFVPVSGQVYAEIGHIHLNRPPFCFRNVSHVLGSLDTDILRVLPH